MVEQLLGGEQATFAMMYYIADKTLRPAVRRWCADKRLLAGLQLEDDIMQDVQLRLTKTCVSHFLLRNGADNPVNYDREGFRNWLFVVARNVLKDYLRRMKPLYAPDGAYPAQATYGIPGDALIAQEITRERMDTLNAALCIALEADASVYKTLVWLAQLLFMLEQDVTRIQSSEMLIREFSQKTLRDMWHTLLAASEKLPWLALSGRHRLKIENDLCAPWDEHRTYGQVRLSEYFMQKGARQSVSDWTNRLNTAIRRSWKGHVKSG